MTANAICSLSLAPQLALVCFENSARTLRTVREAERFAINLLAADQRDVAGLFASKAPEEEKVGRVPHHLRAGQPVIDGTIGWAVCDLRELIGGGDHTIAIGEVIAMGLGAGDPLLWFEGQYRTLPTDRR
jgi:3-hydroxy-9,10-secoandrosta-1,3,5(10)-triene-9,17-dione monooxygenase reductase component